MKVLRALKKTCRPRSEIHELNFIILSKMQEEGKKVFYEQLRDTGTDTNAIYTEIAQDWDSIMDKFGDVMCSELVKLIEARFP